jgi:outer membrane receptor for ferric coprogen and ferric-rhodotorulic acid
MFPEYRPSPMLSMLSVLVGEQGADRNLADLFAPFLRAGVVHRGAGRIDGDGGRLNASVAVLKINQENLAQSTGVTIPGTTPPETAYRTSAGATSEGFELDVSGELTPGWNASAGYTTFKATDADGVDVNSIYPRELLRLFTTYRLPGVWSALTVGGGVNWQGTTYT